LSIKFVARGFVGFMLVSTFTLLAAAQETLPSNPAPSSQPPAQSASQDATQSSQQPAAKPSPSQTAPADKTDKSKDKGQDAGTADASGGSKDRLFFALPNFLTVQNAGQVPPLSPKQKFSIVARSAFDYVQYPWYGLLSGISQAEDSEPGYGQGWAGYGKRYGSAFADGTIENFMVGAVLPSLFHQDPRFFQEEQGTFFHKAGYAVSRIVVTRTDSGKAQFNFSEILGSAISASISTNTYHPTSTILQTPNGPRFIPSDRTLTNTASVWGTQLGYDTITIVIKEFWPDVHRKLSHKQKADAPPAK
jgi:hypothetical protein